MVIELDQEQLDEARNLFEDARSLSKAEQAFRKCTEAVGKAVAAQKRAADRHAKTIREAQDKRVRTHAAVARAKQAMQKIRSQFVPRQVVLAVEQAQAKGRELEHEHQTAADHLFVLQRDLAAVESRRDLEPDDKRMRVEEVQRRIVAAEGEEGRRRELVKAQARVIEKAQEAESDMIEAVYRAATEGPKESKEGANV